MAMSKIFEDMCKEAEINAAIKAAKQYADSETQIVNYLVSTYDYLSEEEAKKLVEDFED